VRTFTGNGGNGWLLEFYYKLKKVKAKPLVDSNYQLQQYPGKGGWTYAAIPATMQSASSSFGW
jgi:hypothetical protein